jgi:hypothetical protein
MYPCFTRKQDALHHYMSLNVSTFDTKLIDRLLIHAEKTMHNLLNRENHVIGPSVSRLWYTAWWDEMTINYNSLIDWIIDWLTVFHLFCVSNVVSVSELSILICSISFLKRLFIVGLLNNNFVIRKNEKKKPHTVAKANKINRQIIERSNIDTPSTPSTHIHDHQGVNIG